jgi:hypothetical protein
VTSGGNVSDDYAQSISDMAREAATKPYTESYRRYVADNPEAIDPGIMLDSLRTGKLQDTLNTISAQGSTPEVKALAQKIAPLVPDTTLKYAASDGSGAVAEYLPATNHVNVFPGGESEQTLLHESVHAATQARIAQAETITQPHTQAEAQLRNAYNEIEQIRQDVIRRVGPDAYGLTNAHEFVAELHSNPEFQQTLKDAAAPGKQSLWTRTVNAVKKLLGLQPAEAEYLNRAMQASEPFFGQPGPDKAGFPLPTRSTDDVLFRKSPKDAADVVDKNYSKMAGLAMDKALSKVNMGRLDLAAYRAALPLVTKQYIADRIRAIPEMVKSGFAKALDAHLAVDEMKHSVTSTIEDPIVQYATKTKKDLAKASGGDADKLRDLEHTMTVIGGEASRGEFDYKMNYADNVKAGRQIDPKNKPYVDDLHRMYTQLKSSNPELAKAIDDGALQSARSNTLKVANITRNLINAAKNAAMASHAQALDMMDGTLKTARNTDASKFADGMHAELDKRLGAAFRDATAKLPQGTVLRDQLAEMREIYNAQKQNPYFSLGRSGDYFTSLHFQNMDAATMQKLQDVARPYGKVLGNLMGGETHAFFRLDNLDAAKGLYNKLVQAGGDKVAPGTGATGKLADRVDSAHGVSPALRSVLASMHETVEQMGLSSEAAAGVRDTMTRELMSLLPETSSRSAIMPRKGIPGYNSDFLGNFASRAAGGVHDTANMYMNPQYADARKGMADAIQSMTRTGSPEMQTRAQMAADEVNKRYANSQNPLDNKAVNLINSLGHTFYLAASPAYLIRTMAQPMHRGLPIAGARYGFVNAAKAIAGAQGTAMKVMANTIADGYSEGGMRGVLDANTSFKNLGLPASEQTFIQELHDRGLLNLGQARQLQSMAMGGTQLQQDMARMASMTAQYAEMSNRLAMGLGAFRLAQADAAKRGVDNTAANTEWAIQTTNRAMDNFDPTNTARAIGKYGFAKGATPLLTAFMNYNLQTMQQIARTVHDGVLGGKYRDQLADQLQKDPTNKDLQTALAAHDQRAKEARKEFAGLMGTTAMISGALGLPFANVFAGVYNTLTNDNNDPHDIRVDVQNFLDRMFGHTLGGVIAHGIPHAANFDSSTFGLENLLPGSEFLASRQLLKDRLGDQSQALMGPALNAGVGIVDAMDKISDGYYAKGIEAALPSGLKPYFKAAELATKGYTDSKGNPIGMHAAGPGDPYGNKASWGDIALQAAGFRTAQRATQSEAQQFVSARTDRLNYQRNLLTDQFYKGITNQSPEQIQQAVGGVTQFNRANPLQPIDNLQQGVEQRLTGLALARITGTGINMTTRQLPTLAQQLLFAEDPTNRAMP